MTELTLHKMNGIGNNFLIYDVRKTENRKLTSKDIAFLSSEGCRNVSKFDQFIILSNEGADNDVFMEIYNNDGSEVDACGNATRCVANLIGKEKRLDNVIIQTNAGYLQSKNSFENNEVSVNMGKPNFNWQNIPLLNQVDDELNLPISFNGVNGAATSIGNPHLVFILEEDISNLKLNEIGGEYENHELFPEKTNVSFANVISESEVNLRVFERGVGETLACGTGACATHIIANRLGMVNDSSKINLPGGSLHIQYSRDNNGKDSDVIMTGAVEYEGLIKVTI